MAKKSPFTKGEKRILEGARRRVSMPETIVSKGRFSLGGEYFVAANVKKITPSTPALTVSRVKDYVAGVSHGAATVMRKAGLLPYKSASAEEQAAKQSVTKARPESKKARVRKAKREARRQKAASKVGIERGAKQRRRVMEFLEKKIAQHERYLKTNREKIAEEQYRHTIHLAHEYGLSDDVIDRLHDSWTVTATA